MMSFAHPEYLQWLLLLPFLMVLYIVRSRIRERKAQKYLGRSNHFLRASISQKKRHLKISLQLLTIAGLIIALARLQSLSEIPTKQKKGGYILLLVDNSLSMLAEDVRPNRLTFMKKELSRLMDKSSGDYMALGIFAQSAFLASPFTKDLSAVQSYLNDLSTDHLSHQGTNFKRAFQFSERIFETIKKNKNSDKALIIASDGEDHSSINQKEVEKLVKEKQVRIFSLAFGSEKGGPLPIRDYKNQIKEYKKDINGQLVISKLESESLKKFAKWGKGSYYHVAYGGQAIDRLRKDLDRMKKAKMEKSVRTKKTEHYQWPLFLAFLIALIEWGLSDRKPMPKGGYYKSGVLGVWGNTQ